MPLQLPTKVTISHLLEDLDKLTATLREHYLAKEASRHLREERRDLYQGEGIESPDNPEAFYAELHVEEEADQQALQELLRTLAQVLQGARA